MSKLGGGGGGGGGGGSFKKKNQRKTRIDQILIKIPQKKFLATEVGGDKKRNSFEGKKAKGKKKQLGKCQLKLRQGWAIEGQWKERGGGGFQYQGGFKAKL